MSSGRDAEQLAAQAAEAVRSVLTEAEQRAAEIIRDAEAKAASIREQAESEASQARERAEADARAQIEAAKRALDELGGTLAAAATAAIPKGETEPQETETEKEEEAQTAEPVTADNGDAAERLVAMKLAVDGKDPAAIESELEERFGPRDRSALLKDVLERTTR